MHTNSITGPAPIRLWCMLLYFCFTIQSENNRLKRQAEADSGDEESSNFQLSDTNVNVTVSNIAEDRSNMFSAMFLITLFITVSLGLAVYAVSVMMWNMDPGRDSVIYRQVSDPTIRMQ